MATDNVNSYNADEEIKFAISMAAMLRTAWDCQSAWRSGRSTSKGHAILATLYERRTAADPAIDRQAEIGIELVVTPSTCKYCPGLLLWTRDDAGKPLPLDPRPFPALAIAANHRWLPDRSGPGDNGLPQMRRARDQIEGYAYRRHLCPGR
jgi:hypothetical protein